MIITDTIKTYAITGLLVALIGLGVYHFSRVFYLEGKVANLEKDKITLEGKLKQCSFDLSLAEQINHRQASLIESQNLSIRSWKEAAEKRQAEVDHAREVARVANAQRKIAYDKLLPLEAAGEACPSLATQLDEYIGARQAEVKK